MRFGEQLDIPGTRSNGIVNDIGESRPEGVTHVAKTLHQRRGARRKLKLALPGICRHETPVASTGTGNASVSGSGLGTLEVRPSSVSRIR